MIIKKSQPTLKSDSWNVQNLDDSWAHMNIIWQSWETSFKWKLIKKREVFLFFFPPLEKEKVLFGRLRSEIKRSQRLHVREEITPAVSSDGLDNQWWMNVSLMHLQYISFTASAWYWLRSMPWVIVSQPGPQQLATYNERCIVGLSWHHHQLAPHHWGNV